MTITTLLCTLDDEGFASEPSKHDIIKMSALNAMGQYIIQQLDQAYAQGGGVIDKALRFHEDVRKYSTKTQAILIKLFRKDYQELLKVQNQFKILGHTISEEFLALVTECTTKHNIDMPAKYLENNEDEESKLTSSSTISNHNISLCSTSSETKEEKECDKFDFQTETVDLSHHQFHRLSYEELQVTIKAKSLHAKHLNLSHNLLGYLNVDDRFTYSEFLPESIEHLNLSNNDFGDDGTIAATVVLLRGASHVKHLNLSNNNLGKAQTRYGDFHKQVIPAIPPKTTHLDLSNNKLFKLDGENYAGDKALAKLPRHVTHLNLSGNLYVPKERGTHGPEYNLEVILTSIPVSVKYVDLSNTDLQALGPIGRDMLAQYFYSSGKVLILDKNNFGRAIKECLPLSILLAMEVPPRTPKEEVSPFYSFFNPKGKFGATLGEKNVLKEIFAFLSPKMSI